MRAKAQEEEDYQKRKEEVKPRTKFKMKETKQSKMNEDDPPKTKSELETHPEDSTARHRRVRLGRRRTGTKPKRQR